MNPLYRNDRPGQMPRSWYVASAEPAADRDPLDADRRCDLAIVGAGYAGLSAALMLARAGRSVAVFDAMRPGEGASSRNGGIASGNIRPSYSVLSRRFGEKTALAIEAEGKVAREFLRNPRALKLLNRGAAGAMAGAAAYIVLKQ